MNIKRGLIRIWFVVSVLWVVGVSFIMLNQKTIGNDPYRINMIEEMFLMEVGGLFVWWGLLYTGFWIVSGFSSDNKKDETNE